MPIVRFARDKRGYEYVYLVHTPTRRGKPGRSRVLYWYRTPPGVRIGRRPFDEDVQRLLEHQNPGVAFDWPTIINTPMPPPDMTEYWRERRKAEKAARQERRAMEAIEAEEAAQAGASQPRAGAAIEPVDLLLEDAPAPRSTEPRAVEASDEDEAAPGAELAPAGEGDALAAKKRRRRRGGRRRKGATADGAADTVAAAGSADEVGAGEDGDPSVADEPSGRPDPTSEGE